MPCKDTVLLEEIYYVPEKRRLLMNKTGRIKREELYVQVAPRKLYFNTEV